MQPCAEYQGSRASDVFVPPKGHFGLNNLRVPQLQVDAESGGAKLEDSAGRHEKSRSSNPGTPQEPYRSKQFELSTPVPLFSFLWKAKFKRFKLESLSVGFDVQTRFPGARRVT